MPDGDIIHSRHLQKLDFDHAVTRVSSSLLEMSSRLTRLYQKPYQWLCEGKANTNQCARIVLKALKRDIKRKGNLPVMLAKQMGESLEQTIKNAGDSGSVDWTALNLEFDRLAQKTDGPHYLKTLVLNAGKSFINDLRYKREVDTNSSSEEILKRYLYNLWESEFKERIPLTVEHHAGIDEVILNRRIEEIQPDIDATGVSESPRRV